MEEEVEEEFEEEEEVSDVLKFIFVHVVVGIWCSIGWSSVTNLSTFACAAALRVAALRVAALLLVLMSLAVV